jgi:DNA end-binding protein Ku
VKADEVDPIYFDRTYYLVPSGTEAQRRPYALLLQAMRDQGVIGIGSFVQAGREKLAAVRPMGDTLALETLFVAEDVKSADEIEEAVASTSVKKEELKLAEQLISGLLGKFEPDEELKSEYRASLRELLEAKVEGREIAEPAPAPAETPVVDLMEALRASVAASAAAKKGSTRKPAAAKKRAAAGRK